MPRLYIAPLLVLLSLQFGCSSNLSLNTNLDKENFDNYFAPSSVKVYDDESSLPSNYRYVGLVEGESCKLKSNDAPANAQDARTDARTKAATNKVNAVIFTSCISIEDKQCLETVVCYGKTFILGHSNK